MKTVYRTLSIILFAVILFSFAPIGKNIKYVAFSDIDNDSIKKELLSVYSDIQINTSIKSSNIFRYEKVRAYDSTIRFHHKGYSRWYAISFNAFIKYAESSVKKYISVESGRSMLKEIRFYHEKYMLSFDSASLAKVNEVLFNNCNKKEANIILQPFMSADKKRQYMAIKVSGSEHNNVILLHISANNPFYTTIVATK